MAGFAGGMAVFGLAALLGVARPAYAPPQPIAAAEVAAFTALARFGDLIDSCLNVWRAVRS